MNPKTPDNEVASTTTTMNPQEINRRIAIACGWTTYIKGGIEWWVTPPPESYHAPVRHCMVVPNFYEDLNAVHRAEFAFASMGCLKEWEWFGKYYGCLCDVCGIKNPMRLNGELDYKRLLHATAAQRAEAFLRTIGQWEEGV